MVSSGKKHQTPPIIFPSSPLNQTLSKKFDILIFFHFFSILLKIHSTKHTLRLFDRMGEVLLQLDEQQTRFEHGQLSFLPFLFFTQAKRIRIKFKIHPLSFIKINFSYLTFLSLISILFKFQVYSIKTSLPTFVSI